MTKDSELIEALWKTLNEPDDRICWNRPFANCLETYPDDLCPWCEVEKVIRKYNLEVPKLND